MNRIRFMFASALMSTSLTASAADTFSSATIKLLSKSVKAPVADGRGQEGRMLIHAIGGTRAGNTAGCYFNNWFEFDTADPSYKDLYAMTMLAYSATLQVDISFDGKWGSTESCRITNITVKK